MTPATTKHSSASQEVVLRHGVWGIWGASSRRERMRAIRQTETLEAAAELLEDGLQGRLDRRVRAYKKNKSASRFAGVVEPLLQEVS